MGIPKFFRYVSERYPLISQLIEENKIPEFDNLYLDFNGIIHNCSHPNDEDAHFRLTEEQIFTAIFTYVEHLFDKIRPKKLFFMAVDGVAPRAKMNQQRGRRFRTAKEAREVREKAIRNGEELPKEKAFDSNCITPGTVFMTKLSEQLRYFVNKKITEDAAWREVEVVLSGHEVPGEGEHKIMEYIRLSKAQPDYNPNVRHCLYGLDADLIMLGLLSHDPHFCLLREEVKFGPAARKKGNSLEKQNFFLLHICLLREYLDLEFCDVAPSMSFPYNLERIIDDFVLFAAFVGNDFLPNLPDIHIHRNGLEKLFDIYKRVLPTLDGYLNEGGIINNQRLQVILDELALTEKEAFEMENMDMNWFRGKQSKHVQAMENARRKQPQTVTKEQKNILEKIKSFILQNRNLPSSQSHSKKLTILNSFAARDRAFVSKLGEALNLVLTWDEFDEEDRNLVTFRFPGSSDEHDDEDSSEGDLDEDDAEANDAVDRVLKKYSEMKIVDVKEEFSDDKYEQVLQERLEDWKREYYKEKLEFDFGDAEQLGKLVYRYVEGLQWVMHYYYGGVASWGWFYDYHYAPRISDLKGIDRMHFEFTLGEPFKPFEQLMGVLPEASRDLVPMAYRDLMYDENSPILDFYPQTFGLDLNGKKADWEAIVKIPFIDQERLLKAMAAREHMLTPNERKRNSIGISTRFFYDVARVDTYPSSLPGFFPDIHRCQCAMEPFNLPTLDGLHLVDGLCDGVVLGLSALAGFPSLKTVPHTAMLAHHNVNVFQSDSHNKSIVIHIQDRFEKIKVKEVAEEMVGKRTFIGWPFLQEGLVVAVSDHLFRYEKGVIGKGQEKVVANPHTQDWINLWPRKVERIEYTYSKRFGVRIGQTEMLVHVRPLKGLTRLDSGALKKEYEETKETEQVAQLTVSSVESEDPRYMEKAPPPLHEEFPVGSKILFLGEHAYGVAAQVYQTESTTLTVTLAFFPNEKAENEKFTKVVNARSPEQYHPSYRVAEWLQISTLALSRITSSFMVLTSDGLKHNLGLSLKFEAKSLKVLDFTRKPINGRGWEYSEKALELIRNYKTAFPAVFEQLDRQGDAMISAADMFPGEFPDSKVKEVRTWLSSNGARDLEPVSLFCAQLKKSTVAEIETLADELNANRSPSSIKKAKVQGIPRQAVLKPSHAKYRLQNQRFTLGDRVIMVQDSGGVPLCAKGVVIGLNNNSIDVIWDVPFVSGTDLGGRCSRYRGSACQFDACLNLTNPQYVVFTRPQAANNPTVFPPRPQFGPRPYLNNTPGGASGFRPAAQPNRPVQIMANPHRGRGGASRVSPSVSYGTVLSSRGRGRGSNGHVDHLRSTLNQGLASPNSPTSNSIQNETSSVLPSRASPERLYRPPAATDNNDTNEPKGPYRGGMNHFRGSSRGGFYSRGGPPFRGGRGGSSPNRGFRGRGRGGPPTPAVQT